MLCFRDDDAGWSDARLFELLDRFAAAAIPLDVAVIPKHLHPALAAELLERAGPRLRLHQHGFAHVDHESARRKWEFGPTRSRAMQHRDIVAGRAAARGPARRRDRSRLHAAVEPLHVETGECLAELGFRVLSRESRATPLRIPDLREVPVHVDWVRLAPPEAAQRLAAAIRSGGPAGVMFHHAEMDTASRDAASELLALVAGHDRARPMSLLEAAERPYVSGCSA